jgi:type I restriction enzyme M protein
MGRRPNLLQSVLPLAVQEPREAYRRIRNFLAGRLVGATRDEALVEEVVKCIFCRAYAMRTRVHLPSDAIGLARAYRATLTDLKAILPDVFGESDELLLDPPSIQYVDQQLGLIDFTNPIRDPIGDAYEAFIGNAVRGNEGQFFTPQSAVRILVEMVDPKPGERIIDPACGAGGFVSHCARKLVASGMPPEHVAESVFGIDKDRYLVRLAAAHVGLVTMQRSGIYCADSLSWAPSEGDKFPLAEQLGTFDVVVTNPPFGSNISTSEDVQRRFELGFKWKLDRHGRFSKSDDLQSSVPPQILFIERCLSLVKPGGRIGVVVPESLLSGKSYRYVVQYVLDNAAVEAVVGMPESLFKTSGRGGTHTKTCLVLLRKNSASKQAASKIFMAEARWCGHDSRGKDIERDDLPVIADRFRRQSAGETLPTSHLGYLIDTAQLNENVLAPRYYDPDVGTELEQLGETHELVMIKDLVDKGALEISTGDEVGKMAYGEGTIPFIRTSDISNWEIKIDPKHCVNEDVYRGLSAKQDVREGDILMVRDGTYLIGTCGYVTKYDTKIVFQSHIYKIRVKKLDVISPFLLLAALSCPPVQRQIKAKRFTQDIIDSLGDRVFELVLPLPRDPAQRKRISEMVARSCHDRVEARELARRASLEIAGVPPDAE